jgi:hypothetical protein
MLKWFLPQVHHKELESLQKVFGYTFSREREMYRDEASSGDWESSGDAYSSGNETDDFGINDFSDKMRFME